MIIPQRAREMPHHSPPKAHLNRGKVLAPFLGLLLGAIHSAPSLLASLLRHLHFLFYLLQSLRFSGLLSRLLQRLHAWPSSRPTAVGCMPHG